MIFIAKEKFGQLIRLTEERWKHIIGRHPEIIKHPNKIKLTLASPDVITINSYNPNEQYYQRYFKTFNNYLIVIVELKKKFIITGFISRKIKKGKIIWKKP